VNQKSRESYQRQVDEAVRTIREDWPEWMRRNRDAVHQPAPGKAGKGTGKARADENGRSSTT
jgi:hypothetical protein